MKIAAITITALLVCLGPQYTKAQIVNMESQRFHRDSAGWSGSIAGNLSLNNNGQEVFSANANAHVQFQHNKDLYLLLGNYGFLKGNGQAFIDNGFLHFRYNHKLGPVVRWEAFLQEQENAITLIRSRFLVGTGPRFKIVSSKKLKLYAASLAMFEHEQQIGKSDSEDKVRSSSYLSFTLLPGKTTEFISTTYYQPVFFDGEDYRLLNELSLNIKTGKKVSVNLNWTYQYDSRPAAGIQKYNYNLSTGIELDL